MLPQRGGDDVVHCRAISRQRDASRDRAESYLQGRKPTLDRRPFSVLLLDIGAAFVTILRRLVIGRYQKAAAVWR
jgi:hypothetical protein